MKHFPYRYISFDCYGTLIDWESGILQALQPWLRARGVSADDAELLELYGKLEPLAEAGEYKSYKEVLALVSGEIATKFGLSVAPEEVHVLSHSLGHWPIFSDTASALRILGKSHQLAILSNVDRDLIAKTLAFHQLSVDLVVTAEDVKAYKPAPVFFEKALAEMGCQSHEVLHCGCSKYHDIRPASTMGMATAWIHRRVGLEGGGATPLSEAEPDMTFGSLRALVEALHA